MASTEDTSSAIVTTDSDLTSESGLSGLRGSESRDGESSQNEDEIGTKLTLKWIYDHFKKDWKTYYRTLELNEKLYFHYKGTRAILLTFFRFRKNRLNGEFSSFKVPVL